MTIAFLLAAVAGLASPVQDPAVIRGVVRLADGTPLEGANVFLVETLDGALTNSEGRFAFRTAQSGAATLAARRIGFKPVRLPLRIPSAELTITMVPDAAALNAVRVQAGRWTAGTERGATLTTMEVVTTPGATANVNRAIQALPGTQNVDEGTALFVRGGDYTETKVLLDGAELLNPTQLRTPTGTFVGTVDPFLLDDIFFSSGGFGARYGNALSGIASLRTLGRASRSSVTASAGLAAVSGSVALALPRTFGLRGAANRLNLRPFLQVNGSPQRYDPPPVGHDASASITWDYRPSGALKFFAIDQQTRLGVGVEEASFDGTFEAGSNSRLSVLNWRDVLGAFESSLAASVSRMTDHESFGAYDLETQLTSTQLSGMLEWQPGGGMPAGRMGAEWEALSSAYRGALPVHGDDVSAGAPTTTLRSAGTGERGGAFAEAEWFLGDRLGATTGVRADRSSLTKRTTLDPRLSLSLAVAPRATLTAAWGIYHQVPGPLLFDSEFGDPGLTSMRATQLVIGGQVEGDAGAVRLELFAKRYQDLAQLTRDHTVATNGIGTSRGADLWLKGRLPAGVNGRFAYSLVAARRTDPTSGILARAPFDVTNSVTAIAERQWFTAISTAVAYRHATGRPFTPVASARRDSVRGVWIPEYGSPMSERLPAYHRVDMSASYFRRFGPSLQGVLYWSLSNALDRENIHAYRYSPDYSERRPVRSIFHRSHYFGASLTWL